MVVLISVVYYSEWRERGGRGRARGEGKGGARWRSRVAAKERGYEGDRGDGGGGVTKRAGEKTEGDDEEEEGGRRVEAVFHPLTRSF